jgi:hypothetical protein
MQVGKGRGSRFCLETDAVHPSAHLAEQVQARKLRGSHCPNRRIALRDKKTLIALALERSRRELNVAVRQELKLNGTLAPEDNTFRVLAHSGESMPAPLPLRLCPLCSLSSKRPTRCGLIMRRTIGPSYLSRGSRRPLDLSPSC